MNTLCESRIGNLSLGITVCHHSASLEMPNGDPLDGFSYPTLMTDSNILSLAKIKDFLIPCAKTSFLAPKLLKYNVYTFKTHNFKVHAILCSLDRLSNSFAYKACFLTILLKNNGSNHLPSGGNIGPRREKICLPGFRQSLFQTSLFSYRD